MPVDSSSPPLSVALGQDPPSAIAALDDESTQALADMITEARRGQERALMKAVDDALRLVPRPFRGVVKRVILP